MVTRIERKDGELTMCQKLYEKVRETLGISPEKFWGGIWGTEHCEIQYDSYADELVNSFLTGMWFSTKEN